MDPTEFTEDDWKLENPSTIMVGGPTMSGKSTLIEQLVEFRHLIFKPAPASVLYCYGTLNDTTVTRMEELGAKTLFGVPTQADINRMPKPLLLILDDLMCDVKDDFLTSLYTRGAHHENMTVVFVTQYWFEKRCKAARDNSQYLFLTRAPNADSQVFELGKQLFR
jgi:hypothetical protein